MAHYRITPLEKKSISIVYEMYRRNPDGSVDWFNIEDHYRWGVGFIEEDMECNLSHDPASSQHCKADAGEYEGCDFDGGVACWFEFSDGIGEEEQEAIKAAYYAGGAGWLYDDPDHEWEEEDCYVVVLPPYQIEFCEQDGKVIREVRTRSLQEVLGLRDRLGDGWIVPTDAALEPYQWKA
jgi:hypothetical protein